MHPLTKRSLNQMSEYWYMGSICARSEMAKKSSEPRVATGMYLDESWSISSSATAASATAARISSEVTLEMQARYKGDIGEI